MQAVSELLKGLAALAWPLIFIAIAWHYRRFIAQMLARDTVSIKVAGMEISVAEAAGQTGKNVADLTKRVAQIEEKLGLNLEGSEAQAPDLDSPILLWVGGSLSDNAFLIDRLEADGIRVLKELSANSALNALARESVRAIIVDLARNKNGADSIEIVSEFVKSVRSKGSSVPILVYAGRRGEEYRGQLLTAGATEFTIHPVEVFRFVAAHLGDK